MYPLPDSSIIKSEDSCFKVWIPEETCIVLGISNKAETALNVEAIEADNIPVYKRSTGGQTVVLSKNTIIISLLLKKSEEKTPKEIFHEINTIIINTLKEFGLQNLQERGISDIAIGERKILGSSMYRRKETAFYHAVLNYGESVRNIEKYLKHPSKEPDYRKRRPHSHFITSLTENNIKANIHDVLAKLETAIEQAFFL